MRIMLLINDELYFPSSAQPHKIIYVEAVIIPV